MVNIINYVDNNGEIVQRNQVEIEMDARNTGKKPRNEDLSTQLGFKSVGDFLTAQKNDVHTLIDESAQEEDDWLVGTD